MSFSKLANRELKIGEKILLINNQSPSHWSPFWANCIVEIVNSNSIKMIKPTSQSNNTVGTEGLIWGDELHSKYEGIKWKRVGEKKNHLPVWL